MNDIICPHCGKAFKIDEAGYADILKQVRDNDFENQLHERLELAERDKRSAVELARAQMSAELQKQTAAREAEIQSLKSQLQAEEMVRQLAVTQALAESDAAAKGEGPGEEEDFDVSKRLSACRDVGYESLKVPHRPVPTTNRAHILDDPEGRAIPAAHLRFKIVDRLPIPELREKLRPAPRLDI